MKLATTTGDLIYYCDSVEEAIRTFEGTGFKHLDYSFWRSAWDDRPILKDNWMDSVKDASREAEKLGFDFVQAHSPGNNFLNCEEDEFENVVLANTRAIEACSYLGIKKIVVHSGSKKELLYPDGKEEYFKINKPFFERLYPAMEKYGVKVLIENGSLINSGGKYFFMTGKDMSDFIDYCGHPLLGACWDTGHGNMQTESIYDEIISLGDKLEALHVQDNFETHDDHLAPYMGTLDIDALMNALLDGGFAKRGCYFTFECDNIISENAACAKGRNRDTRFIQRANVPTPELKKAAVKFMYEIGKTILTSYDCFED